MYRPALSSVDALDPRESRLQEIQSKWRQFPGRAPNGTGETGLMSSDAQGWSNMLNEQTEAMDLSNELHGKAPVSVRQGRSLGGMSPSLSSSPAWWLDWHGGAPQSPSLESLPLSMRGLFSRG